MRRGRPPQDDILTPREWQVLELIEAGLTNEQIAERLEISFGTAKYHVAEIMSKLGVSSREEVSATARRNRAPVLPFSLITGLRGRLTLAALGAGAVAVLLLLATIVFTDHLRDKSASSPQGDYTEALADFDPGDAPSRQALLGRAPEPLSSYYYRLEVTGEEPLVQEDRRRLPGLDAEVWFEAPNRWRTHYRNAVTGEVTSIYVTDGKTVWSYRPGASTYTRTPYDPDEGIRRPLLGVVSEESLADFMDEWRDGPSHYWEVKEAEELEGIRTVHLVQVCCSIQRMGEEHYWIDPTHLFLMGMESRSLGTGSVVRYKVTDVQYNPDLDDDVFTFEPPDGVTEAPPP